MRRNRAWEIGSIAALLLVVGLAAANGYSWHRRQQALNASLAAELVGGPVGSTSAIHRLLHQGADIRTRGRFGFTVLTAAAQTGDLPLATQALDSSVPLDGWALFVAAGGGSSSVVELLLARGAMPDDGGDDAQGRTPLMWAACVGKPATIRALLSAGADPTLRDVNGETALSYAQRASLSILPRAPRGLARDAAETVRLLKDALARKRGTAMVPGRSLDLTQGPRDAEDTEGNR